MIGNVFDGHIVGTGLNFAGSYDPPYPTFYYLSNTVYGGGGYGLGVGPSSSTNNIYAQGFGCTPLTPSMLSLVSVSYLLIYNGSSPIQPTGCLFGPSVIEAAPQFVSPSTGDFHLLPTSPAINAGDPTAPNLPAVDFDGKNRFVCGTIDLGAYEHHPQPPIALSSNLPTSVGGTSVTFTAQLTGNCNTPTGLLTFLDGSVPSATAVLNGSAGASVSTAALTVGTHAISASYPGDFNFNPSVAPAITQVVTGYPTATTLTVSPNPAAALSPVLLTANVTSAYGVPAGTVSFFAGASLVGSVMLDGAGHASVSVSTLPAGTSVITAVFNATIYFAASTSAPVSEVVTGAPTVTTLASNMNPSTFGQTVLLTANVAAPGSSVRPAGMIQFQEGAAVLGTATLSSAGIATLSLSSLAVGSHQLLAAYLGSTNANPSVSGLYVQVVQPQPIQVNDFSLILAPAAVLAASGQTAETTLNLASLGIFSGTVDLRVGQIPALAAASFDAPAVTLVQGGTASSVLTIRTVSLLATEQDKTRSKSSLPEIAGCSLVSILLCWRRGRRKLLPLLACCVVFAVTALSGCRNVGAPADTVAAGTYLIPVVATDQNTGITHTVNLTLTVQPTGR